MTITPSPSSHVWNSGFTLTVIASGGTFSAGSVVHLLGTVLSTTFVDSTHLTAVVPANMTNEDTTVASLAVYLGSTLVASTHFTFSNPAAGSYSISPTFVTLGDGDTTLTVNGSNFAQDITVKIGSLTFTTLDNLTWISSTKITVLLTAAQMATLGSGTQTLQVSNPTPGGGGPGSGSFPIYDKTPSLTSISPTSCSAGAGSFTLTVHGSNFLNGSSTIYWNGSARATVFDSSTQLHCTISAADVAATGNFPVKVRTTNAKTDSNSISFAVSNNNPVPTIGTLSPTGAATGSSGFTLTVNGTNFVSGQSVVRWNGSNRATTFVSTTQLQAAISASDVAVSGSASVTVFNPTPGGGLSNAVGFNISAPNPVPVLSSVSPASAHTGDPDTLITLIGSDFVTASVVKWNGVSLATTYVASTQLTAIVPAADLVADTTASITVFNPAPAGGTSAAFSFVVSSNNPVPALTLLSPNETTAGATGFDVTLTGTGFIASSQGKVNGSNRTTTYIGPTSLRVTVLTGDLAAAGTLSITVTNPAAGGGTSNALPLTVDPAANPVPSIASLSPSSIARGGAGFTLAVNGSGFIGATAVFVNGSSKQVTYVNSGQVSVPVSAADFAKAPGAILKLNPKAVL